MKLTDGVEWAVHCCTILAVLPDDEALPSAVLAEIHGVPPAYLAKHLQALTAAGVTRSIPGPRGGYRLARPAHEVTVLDVVIAVDGDDTAFRCTEIRQRNPVADPDDPAYRHPCHVARVMWRAEDAWRAELAATTIADLVGQVASTVPPEQLERFAEWLQTVQIKRRKR